MTFTLEAEFEVSTQKTEEGWLILFGPFVVIYADKGLTYFLNRLPQDVSGDIELAESPWGYEGEGLYIETEFVGPRIEESAFPEGWQEPLHTIVEALDEEEDKD